MSETKLDDFSKKLPHRTLGIRVEESEFWVSREELASLSPIFNKMLLIDDEGPNKTIIPLPEKKASDILEMFRCIFRVDGTTKQIDSGNIDLMLGFSDEYSIKYLRLECEKFLMTALKRLKESEETQDEMVTLFVRGVQYKFKDIVRRLLPAVARIGVDSFDKFSENRDMPARIRCAIYAQLAGNVVKHQYEPHAVNNSCTTYFPHRTSMKTQQRCIVCGFVACDDCRVTSFLQMRCFVCHKCKKLTLRNDFRNFGSGEFTGCQCVHEAADEELKKIGF